MIDMSAPVVESKSRFSPLFVVSVQEGEPLVIVVVVSSAGAAALYMLVIPRLIGAKDQTLPSARRYFT
jgi:hypothetical protein